MDDLHGGTGGGNEPTNNNLNNILFAGDGTQDSCSNGPLKHSRYAGTDRGDIRHPSCELPATGQSESVPKQGSTYVFNSITICEGTGPTCDVPRAFDWDNFR